MDEDRLWTWASIAVIALFVVLFASTADQPYHLDNVDFPAVSEATALTGIPICYRGEQKPLASGLFHPPLYIYSLAAWMKMFGPGEAKVRLFGMICTLLQAWVVLEILRTLFGSSIMRRWAPVFLALYLWNPFTLQTATITDIDTTVYGPLLCAALLATLRISWRDGEWRTDPVRRWEYILIGAVLLLCLWAKLTTIWLTYPFVFLLLISRLGVRRALGVSALLTVASVAVFAVTYALYGAITGMNVGFTLGFTWMSFTKRGSSGTPGLAARWADLQRNILFMGPFMLAWTGLFPWVASLTAMGMAAVTAWRKRDRRMQHYALVLGIALLCTAGYCAKVATFGFAPFKYVAVYWGLILTAPLFVLAGPDWLNESRRPWRMRIPVIAMFLAGGYWGLFYVRDDLMLHGFQGWYAQATLIPAFLLIAGLRLWRRMPDGWAVAAAGLALYCGVHLGTAIYQERVPYATTYDYGQTGFLETVAFLTSQTGPDDIIVSMKDIGFRTGRRYYENYPRLYASSDGGILERAIDSGRVSYMVFTEHHGQDQLDINPPFRDWFLSRCTLVRSFGDYRVYQLTAALARKQQAECAQGAK